MNLRAVKGMNDILPQEVQRWQQVEAAFRRLAELYGFSEIRTPIVEQTSLFVRSIGEATDVVEKEMYSFQRHDNELTIRPEGTAGAARAYVEHKFFNLEAISRWYYIGPMFRGERPARGRHRQFHQAGAEIYGDPGPVCDADLIAMLIDFYQELGIADLHVLINSLGSKGTRERYRDALLAYLTPLKDRLSEDSQRRLSTNPLRVLDSKAAEDRNICGNAPKILDLLDDEDRRHFDGLQNNLDKLNIKYTVEPRLVRGLDYYTRTLFEIQGSGGELGAQNALCGGGRYDNMVKELGGPAVPAIGFALGIERLLLAMAAKEQPVPATVYLAPLGEQGQAEALVLARELRQRNIRTIVDGRTQKLKTMLHRADASGAQLCAILGDGELERGVVQIKDLKERKQAEVPRDQVVSEIEKTFVEAGLLPLGGGPR
jgi:histidyl-tRNA synthetase